MTSPTLTAREWEIAVRVAQNMSYDDIGRSFTPTITEATVRTHVRNIARKLPTEQAGRPLPPKWAVFMFMTNGASSRQRVAAGVDVPTTNNG